MEKIGGKAMGIMVAVVLLAGIGSLGYSGVIGDLFKKSPADSAKEARVMEIADAVKIPLKALDSGKALFLSLDAEGRQLHYFALKSRDGAFRPDRAVDAESGGYGAGKSCCLPSLAGK
jgi:hypothetical protein